MSGTLSQEGEAAGVRAAQGQLPGQVQDTQQRTEWPGELSPGLTVEEMTREAQKSGDAEVTAKSLDVTRSEWGTG